MVSIESVSSYAALSNSLSLSHLKKDSDSMNEVKKLARLHAHRL